MFKHPLFFAWYWQHVATTQPNLMLGTHLRMFSQILTTPGVQRRLKVSGLNWGLTGLTLTLKWVNIILLLQCKSDWLELSSIWYFRTDTFATRLQWVTANENEHAEKWLKAVSSSKNNTYKNGMDHFYMYCVNWRTLTRNIDAFYKILSAP